MLTLDKYEKNKGGIIKIKTDTISCIIFNVKIFDELYISDSAGEMIEDSKMPKKEEKNTIQTNTNNL